MGRYVYDETFGERYYQDDAGNLTIAPETTGFEAALINTGEQLHDFGRGIRGLVADDAEQARLNAEGQASNDALANLRQERPIASVIGEALPSLATAPLSASGLVANLGLQAGLGAVEGYLDADPGVDQAGRTLMTAAGGVLGEVGGRMAGRVASGIKGLVDDFAGVRAQTVNPAAAEFERLGGRTLPSQRVNQESAAFGGMSRAEQGAESSILSPSIFRETAEQNRQLVNQRALDAIGLPDADDLSVATIGDATDRLSDEFSRISSVAAGEQPFNVGTEFADRLAGTRGQIPELIKRGEFKGLDQGMLSGSDWNVARRALAQDAAERAAKGQHELADSIWADVELLDHLMESRVGPDLGADFARAREQYRVLQVLQKPGVIRDGDVSVRTLNNRLNQNTGFGATARQGRDTVNQETKGLIDLARAASDRSLQRAPSSGTTERQALREFAGAVGGLDLLNAAGQLAGPAAVGASTRGGGNMIGNLYNPAPQGFGQLGGSAGRGFIDQYLYPFVGSEDDRIDVQR
jgi:hypothetical protein